MAEEKTVVEQLKPVTVNVVGTGDGGITRDTVAATPADQPDLHVRYVDRFEALLARFTHLYVTTLSSLVVAGKATDLIQASDFLHLFIKCASLALAVAAVDLLKSLGTITSQWAKDHPLLSGEV